jgi:NAD(P)-dependent dehydrogenase (short-subunit alcohol dehydrogenase family)
MQTLHGSTHRRPKDKKDDVIRRGLLVTTHKAPAWQSSVANQIRPRYSVASALLQGKVAVVTGAASGIGRAIAVEMAANGADIVGIDICSRLDLEQTAKLVRHHQRKFFPFVGDIRNVGFLQSAADDAERQAGRIDIVVANAEMEGWLWPGIIDNTLNRTTSTIEAFGPKLARRGEGCVIVVSSMQYPASRREMIDLMKSAALEFGQQKITVNALIPGLVHNSLTRSEARWSAIVAEVEVNPSHPPMCLEMKVALKVPWLKLNDLAPAAVFLASDLAAMVPGACYDTAA